MCFAAMQTVMDNEARSAPVASTSSAPLADWPLLYGSTSTNRAPEDTASTADTGARPYRRPYGGPELARPRRPWWDDDSLNDFDPYPINNANSAGGEPEAQRRVVPLPIRSQPSVHRSLRPHSLHDLSASLPVGSIQLPPSPPFPSVDYIPLPTFDRGSLQSDNAMTVDSVSPPLAANAPVPFPYHSPPPETPFRVNRRPRLARPGEQMRGLNEPEPFEAERLSDDLASARDRTQDFADFAEQRRSTVRGRQLDAQGHPQSEPLLPNSSTSNESSVDVALASSSSDRANRPLTTAELAEKGARERTSGGLPAHYVLDSEGHTWCCYPPTSSSRPARGRQSSLDPDHMLRDLLDSHQPSQPVPDATVPTPLPPPPRSLSPALRRRVQLAVDHLSGLSTSASARGPLSAVL